MFLQPFFVKGLAHSSYLLGGTHHCVIIDPRRDVEVYLQAAKDLGMTITHILETHLHADFVSGHLELAEKTGARIYAPKAGNCAFEHEALVEGDTFDLDDVTIRVLETPGHTPEHISYVVVDRARGDDPVALFCGDTLFVGDVGRPDLFPGMATELASKLFDSLHEKILKLPDACEVYPAHGAGSLCGRAMGAKRSSTIGYERRYNAALQIRDRDAFITSLTTNMPPAPDHFSRCSAINAQGPQLLRELPILRPMSPAAFDAAMREQERIVLDARSYESFGGMHIANAYHVDQGGNFPTFCGWILPPKKEILLVTHDDAQACEASVWLRRVGLDRTIGYLDGGMYAWANEGNPAGHIPQLSAGELHGLMQESQDICVVDVRASREFDVDHIEGAINIPAPELRTRDEALDKAKHIVTICSTGHRSSIAASLLAQRDFTRVSNVAGGMTGYSAAGYAKTCPMCVGSHGPRFLGQRTSA